MIDILLILVAGYFYISIVLLALSTLGFINLSDWFYIDKKELKEEVKDLSENGKELLDDLYESGYLLSITFSLFWLYLTLGYLWKYIQHKLEDN